MVTSNCAHGLPAVGVCFLIPDFPLIQSDAWVHLMKRTQAFGGTKPPLQDDRRQDETDLPFGPSEPNGSGDGAAVLAERSQPCQLRVTTMNSV
jgi:hypothetical protein